MEVDVDVSRHTFAGETMGWLELSGLCILGGRYRIECEVEE